tara:strand:- start:1377 stop:2030 length:654 start_codon:yes stop_codon:yes gene_type:complete
MLPCVISIEGNIGSGKSTILNILKTHFSKNPEICFLTEPVLEWQKICDSDGVDIIQKYYENQEKYAFSFQMMAYITRLRTLRKAMKDGYKYIVTERSPLSDKMIFAQMLYDDGKIEKINFEIYNQWFSTFFEDIPKINIIYIKTEPNIAEKRVHNRSRRGEDIPLSYLVRCHQYHESWMDKKKGILTINGNKDLTDQGFSAHIIASFNLFIQEIGST